MLRNAVGEGGNDLSHLPPELKDRADAEVAAILSRAFVTARLIRLAEHCLAKGDANGTLGALSQLTKEQDRLEALGGQSNPNPAPRDDDEPGSPALTSVILAFRQRTKMGRTAEAKNGTNGAGHAETDPTLPLSVALRTRHGYCVAPPRRFFHG
jgi:hypothetical protein